MELKYYIVTYREEFYTVVLAISENDAKKKAQEPKVKWTPLNNLHSDMLEASQEKQEFKD